MCEFHTQQARSFWAAVILRAVFTISQPCKKSKTAVGSFNYWPAVMSFHYCVAFMTVVVG